MGAFEGTGGFHLGRASSTKTKTRTGIEQVTSSLPSTIQPFIYARYKVHLNSSVTFKDTRSSKQDSTGKPSLLDRVGKFTMTDVKHWKVEEVGPRPCLSFYATSFCSYNLD